jgi:hypothetical protein
MILSVMVLQYVVKILWFGNGERGFLPRMERVYTDKRRGGILAEGDAADRAGDGFSGLVYGGDLEL